MGNESTLSLGKKNDENNIQKEENFIKKGFNISTHVIEEIEKKISFEPKIEQKNVKELLENQNNKTNIHDLSKDQITVRNSNEAANINVKRPQTAESSFINIKQQIFDKYKNNIGNIPISENESRIMVKNSTFINNLSTNDVSKNDQNQKIIKEVLREAKNSLRPKSSSKYKKLPMDPLIKSQSPQLSISKFAALIALRSQKLMAENINSENPFHEPRIRPVSAYYPKKTPSKDININSKDHYYHNDQNDINDEILNIQEDSESSRPKNRSIERKTNFNTLENDEYFKLKPSKFDRPKSAITGHKASIIFQEEKEIIQHITDGNNVKLGEILKNGHFAAFNVQQTDNKIHSNKDNSLSLEYFKDRNFSIQANSHGSKGLIISDNFEKEIISSNLVNVNSSGMKFYIIRYNFFIDKLISNKSPLKQRTYNPLNLSQNNFSKIQEKTEGKMYTSAGEKLYKVSGALKAYETQNVFQIRPITSETNRKRLTIKDLQI